MYTENHHSSPEGYKNNHNHLPQASKRKKRPLQRKPLPEESSLKELHDYPPLSPKELEQLAHKGNILREEGEDVGDTDLPSKSEWSTRTPPDLQILLDQEPPNPSVDLLKKTIEKTQEKAINEKRYLPSKPIEIHPILETTIEAKTDPDSKRTIPLGERRILSEDPTDLPDLGFPSHLDPKELNLQRADELEKQLTSFDQRINKLQQEEKKSWFKGAVRKRLEQARQAREAIWNAHEELLKEIKGDYPGILQHIETQLAQQREEIRHLQSSYDKAWYGREGKRQQLEQAKTKRNILLEKRNKTRQKAGIVDTQTPVMIKQTSEKRLENLLENIKKELEEKRKNVLRLKSVYDKSWFWSGRKEKREQFENAKKEFVLYARKLKETHKEEKELNDYLETVEKALFDEWS